MRSIRIVLAALCVAAAGLVVSAAPANAVPPPLLPPALTKSFTPTTIPVGSTTLLVS
jgi:hypothetical protein